MKPLWKHQAEAIAKASVCRDVALLMDPGVGKSRATIEIIRRKFAEKGRVRRTIILAPKVVCSNWKREFAEYSKINPLDIVILQGTAAKRMDEFKKKCEGQNKIIITNYEAMQMVHLTQAIWLWKPEILVADESHRCKNFKSKRAKMVESLAMQAEHRYILTGTPVLNSPMDLFQQFKILDKGDTFGTNFWAFRGRFFEDKNARWAGKPNYFPKWEPRATAFEELSGLINKTSVKAKKEECLDLPPLIRQRIEVEMSTEQKRAYESMRKDYVAFVQSKTKQGEPLAVVAQLAITKALRLQQIVSGFAKTDRGDEVTLSNPRLDALKDLLEDYTDGHKVIVWAVFKQNYKDIAGVCESLGIKWAELHGETKDKDAEIEKFRKDPECRVLIANQGAAGIGINLTESDISIYYSKGFSLEHDIQSEARNYRGGSEQHQKITRIDLVCPNTIDDIINEALAKKTMIGELTLLNYGKDEV
jgi:SNF2 family DNA or RNA helicase